MFLQYRLTKAYWHVVHAKEVYKSSCSLKSHLDLCKAREKLHYLSLRCGVIESSHIQSVLFEGAK